MYSDDYKDPLAYLIHSLSSAARMDFWLCYSVHQNKYHYLHKVMVDIALLLLETTMHQILARQHCLHRNKVLLGSVEWNNGIMVIPAPPHGLQPITLMRNYEYLYK